MARAEVPVAHFVEWLAEWGRDVRRRQRGLLLLTAHRAKGLEFDHVAVLDGGWSRIDEDEDPDAPRRLLYVAMTRARQTLALAQIHNPRAPPQSDAARAGSIRETAPPAYAPRRHRLRRSIENSSAVLQRPRGSMPRESAKDVPKLSRRYLRPGLDEIHLGFAGRQRARAPVHRAIAALAPGDPLQLRVDARERWELLDRAGVVVGRLARAFEPPAAMRCVSAAVHAVVVWSRDASEPRYHDQLECDEWEVVVPELVFEPDD